MDRTVNIVGHAGFTWGAYLMSNWTEIGAAALMVLQGVLLLLKIYEHISNRNKKGGNDREQ